jgi:RNA polymerase sigma-70 factor (ECF subfamily)
MTSFAKLGDVPNLTTQEDAVLVRAVRKGHSQAFAALYDRYFDAIYRYVFFRVADQADAEDLTQRIFLNLLEAIRNDRSAINELKPYLYRSAHNLVVDHYRRQKPVPTNRISFHSEEAETAPDHDPLPEEQVTNKFEHVRIARALAQMDITDQQVLTCRFINNLNSKETAQIMGITEGHLRVLQFRALKKLREIVAGKDDGND